MKYLKILICMAVASAMLSCTGIGTRPQKLEPTLFLTQPLARTAERAPPFARRIAEGQNVMGGGIAGMLIGAAVTATINNDERARSRIYEVPSPNGVDPAAIIETAIGEHLIAEFGARPNIGEFYAGSVRETTSLERAPQIAALAQRRGLSGIVIDVVALEYYADSTGRNLGLVDEAFAVNITAQLTLIDVATGAILASGSCAAANDNVQLIENVVEDGSRLTSLMAQKAAANCAQQLIDRNLQ